MRLQSERDTDRYTKKTAVSENKKGNTAFEEDVLGNIKHDHSELVVL